MDGAGGSPEREGGKVGEKRGEERGQKMRVAAGRGVSRERERRQRSGGPGRGQPPPPPLHLWPPTPGLITCRRGRDRL